MKLKLLIILGYLWCNNLECLCQNTDIPTSKVDSLHVQNYLLKEDSVVQEFTFPSIEVFRFKVVFSSATINVITNEIHLKGKVTGDSITIPIGGIPGVTIFQSLRDNKNTLRNFLSLGETGYSPDNPPNNGYFDIVYKPRKGESLFFYMQNFYLEEFKLWKLLLNRHN